MGYNCSDELAVILLKLRTKLLHANEFVACYSEKTQTILYLILTKLANA